MSKSSSTRDLVLVTGGSGFLAGYCIAQLLNDGWSVRTTVRSIAKSKAVRASIGDIGANPIGDRVRRSQSQLGCGLEQGGRWRPIRAACRFARSGDRPEERRRIGPTGARRNLRVRMAGHDAGVKRVVMTSSISAIIFGRGVREQPSPRRTDETNRGDTFPYDDTSPYDRAKTIAERTAWAWFGCRRRQPRTRHRQPRPDPRPREQTFRFRLSSSRSCWTARSPPCRVSASRG